VDSYLTELTLLAKRLCPEARIEATTESFEDEDGHVRIYPPAGLGDKEIAEIEGQIADRCVDVLVKHGVFIVPPFTTEETENGSVPVDKS